MIGIYQLLVDLLFNFLPLIYRYAQYVPMYIAHRYYTFITYRFYIEFLTIYFCNL